MQNAHRVSTELRRRIHAALGGCRRQRNDGAGPRDDDRRAQARGASQRVLPACDLPTTRPGARGRRDLGCRAGCVALAAACGIAVLSPSGAAAHCSAKDVLERHRAGMLAPAPAAAAAIVRSAAEAPVWRTIDVGTFKNSFALRNALDALNCGVGNGAAEVLARPSFVLAPERQELDLVSITAAQLGLPDGTVALGELYMRAGWLGLELAPAEIGPQLRLQYAGQPVGEFLIVGMRPIRTWSGESLVLVVANGGAGLYLLSQDAHAEIHSGSRVLFVRRRHDGDVALAAQQASAARAARVELRESRDSYGSLSLEPVFGQHFAATRGPHPGCQAPPGDFPPWKPDTREPDRGCASYTLSHRPDRKAGPFISPPTVWYWK